jgi:hypothetical protein
MHNVRKSFRSFLTPFIAAVLPTLAQGCFTAKARTTEKIQRTGKGVFHPFHPGCSFLLIDKRTGQPLKILFIYQ